MHRKLARDYRSVKYGKWSPISLEAYGTPGSTMGMETWIDGEYIGETFIPVIDPRFHINVSRLAAQITIVAAAAPGAEAHTLRIKSVHAIVSSQPPGSSNGGPLGPWNPIYDPHSHPTCGSCVGLPFPSVGFHSVMGALSDQAVKLVNELRGYTNYADYGQYLLPIRKAGLESRSIAENLGDASGEGRPYFIALLTALNNAEPYLVNIYELDNAYELGASVLRHFLLDCGYKKLQQRFLDRVLQTIDQFITGGIAPNLKAVSMTTETRIIASRMTGHALISARNLILLEDRKIAEELISSLCQGSITGEPIDRETKLKLEGFAHRIAQNPYSTARMSVVLILVPLI